MLSIEILFELNTKEIPVSGTIQEKKQYIQSIYPLICNRLLRYCKITDQNHTDINICNIKSYFNNDELLENLKCLVVDYQDIDLTINLLDLFDLNHESTITTDLEYTNKIHDYLDLDNRVLLNLADDSSNLRDDYLKSISSWFRCRSTDLLTF